MAAQKPRECRAEVAGIRWPRPEVVEVDLRMVEPSELNFEAGQWISVPFGPQTVRAWTILSSPTRKRTITLSVDVAPGGMGSQWLRALKPGDLVTFKGPTGGFVFNRADPRRAVFVAEEIGIVPVRSILADLYETGYGRPTILIYWARDPSWLLYDAEFRSLARRHPDRIGPSFRRTLERRVAERTAELLAINDRLRLEIAERQHAEAARRELQRIDVRKPDDRRLMLVLADRASLGDIEGAERDLHASRLMTRPSFRHYTEARIAFQTVTDRGGEGFAYYLPDVAAWFASQRSNLHFQR